MPRNARERVLTAARELFASDGIRAVSIEQILDTSGVGRASFYRHFPSKDEMVVAVLDHYNHRWQAMLREQVPTRGDGVLGVFDILAERFTDPDYRGCLALTALIEFREADNPIHQSAVKHQESTTVELTNLLDSEFPGLPPEKRETLGCQLLQLVDAAMLASLYESGDAPALRAKATAEALLTHQSR